MKVTAEKNEKIANMIFASIYPLYWNRLEKHGRTRVQGLLHLGFKKEKELKIDGVEFIKYRLLNTLNSNVSII
jgi:hypothetical protein